jgi:hypothetical protein
MILRERRGSARVNYLCECQVESEGLRANKVTGRINDLSPEGAFIDSMSWLPIGTRLTMKFKIQDREIQAGAEVRYFIRHIGMGVRFVGLAPNDRQIIECALTQTTLPEAAPLTEPAPQPESIRNAPGSTERGQRTVAAVADEAAGSRPVMAGDLGAVSLFDIIDIIENNRLTGLLNIGLGGLTSEIQFNEGMIVGALDASSVGITALNRILGSLGETFEFFESPNPYFQTIRSSDNTSLLLDMLIHNDDAGSCTLNMSDDVPAAS